MTPTLDRLVKVLGPSGTRHLCDRFGGRHVYLSAAPAADRPIARLLGARDAARLARVFGCGRLYIPSWPEPKDLVSAVAQLTGDGRSANEIAGELGVSNRTVHRLRARARARSLTS